MVWFLYIATIAYTLLWFSTDPEAMAFAWYVRHLLRPSNWRDRDWVVGTLHWDVYGRRVAKLLMLLILHGAAILWLALTYTWPFSVAALCGSVGVIAALPWIHAHTAPCRVGIDRRHYQAVLHAVRDLPRLQDTPMVIDDREYLFHHDAGAPTAFLLRHHNDWAQHVSLGGCGFLLDDNRVAMMLRLDDGLIELLEPGQRPSSFVVQFEDWERRYELLWAVEYEPGLFYSLYDDHVLDDL